MPVRRQRINPKKRAEMLLKMVEAGEYLTQLRNDRGLSLAQLGADLNISPNYLSEVERGIKCPSDEFIRQISEYYSRSEEDLFFRYGKVPLLAREELEEFPALQKTLTEIRSNSKLSEEQKNEIYDTLHRTYKQFSQEVED